jgi:tripartite-type tricarboxylate transporter receptor subunit TctC
MKRTRAALCLALFTMAAAPLAAWGQAQKPAAYPSKPVRIFVGNAAGGGVDVICRVVAQKLTERWGSAVLVENVPGGNGVIAMERTVQAAPDGHTFISGGASIELHAVYKRYDVLKALAPVAQMTTQPYLLVVTSSLPVKSVKEYAAYAKARPGQLNYATAGIGSSGHLGHEMFNEALGVQTTHIPYKGSGAATADLINGRVQLMFISTLSGMPHVRSGAVRALGMTGLKRSPSMPDLPAVAETVPDFEMNNGYGLFTNIKSPPAAVAAMNREVMQVMALAEMKSKLDADGAEAEEPHTPAEYRDRVAKRIAKWSAFVEAHGIKSE